MGLVGGVGGMEGAEGRGETVCAVGDDSEMHFQRVRRGERRWLAAFRRLDGPPFNNWREGEGCGVKGGELMRVGMLMSFLTTNFLASSLLLIHAAPSYIVPVPFFCDHQSSPLFFCSRRWQVHPHSQHFRAAPDRGSAGRGGALQWTRHSAQDGTFGGEGGGWGNGRGMVVFPRLWGIGERRVGSFAIATFFLKGLRSGAFGVPSAAHANCCGCWVNTMICSNIYHIVLVYW